MKTVCKVLLSDCFHSLKILPHFMIVSTKLRLSFLSFCLAGLNEFLLKFESNLCLKRNDLRDEPLNGYAILIEFVNVSTVCLSVFTRVQFEKNA